jgi:all-trans-8'-apo-beta-carotenal 15,15'-oxygenase
MHGQPLTHASGMQAVEALLAVPDDVPAYAAKDWAAAFVSQRGEFDYWVEGVEGTIPEFLRGTLFRNGPGNFGALHCPGWWSKM